jgi:hypothetical protein
MWRCSAPGNRYQPPSSKSRAPAANVKPSVKGVFKGNGKEAKLAPVSAHRRKPFNNQPWMVLVLTEKDLSALGI